MRRGVGQNGLTAADRLNVAVENRARLDEMLTALVGSYGQTVELAGLDARFHWTKDIPALVYALGVVVYLAGHAIMQWARYTNRFFSSMVRIQTDRGQTVCKEGPYRYVRHPGYVGGILFEVTTGIVLGSWWACVPQVIAALLLIWRTSKEDRTLQSELPGYDEYARETRFRLLPGVW